MGLGVCSWLVVTLGTVLNAHEAAEVDFATFDLPFGAIENQHESSSGELLRTLVVFSTGVNRSF